MATRGISIAAVLTGVVLAAPVVGQDASQATIEANRALLDFLPFDDETDFENARRGFIATLDEDVIAAPPDRAPGGIAYDLTLFDFLDGDPPDTVNPSLWRQSKLNAISGLFEVVPGIYQVRGFDLANMSFIRGETGWIVVDPLTVVETAEAGLGLLRQEVEDLPVSAVIITHSHADHFGGVRGVISEEEIAERDAPVIVPEGFFEEATSENLIAGNAMGRRAFYMYGNLLERSPRGSLGSGLGTTTATGTFTIIEPTIIIDETPTELTVDGIEMTFLNVPGAEAPAHLMFYIHPFEAMMQAEIINHTMHNLLTLRGAKVRSDDLFAKYIHDTINRFGDRVEVSFGSHHWPTWGNAEILEFWEGQRDTYRYLHDEVLRLANHGLTMVEIAEEIELPDSLAQRFANRGYYGSVSHNAKAQYQLYYGWFRAARPADEQIVALDDHSHILADSFSQRIEINEQVSRAEVWRDVLTGIDALDDPDNYRSVRVTVGEQFGPPRVRSIASRWLKTEGQAALTGTTLLQASNEPPRYVTLEVGAKDAHRVGPGTPIRLTTRNLQDETGAVQSELFVVTEAVERGGERVRLTMRSIGGFPGISVWTADDAPNWASATEEQKAEQGFWTDDDGLIDGVDPRSVWT